MVRTEIRQALRGMMRRPRFFAVSAGTLALGIGAATAVFSVVHAVLLTPPPFAQADRLVLVSQVYGEAARERRRVPAPDVANLRAAPEFASVAWVRGVADGSAIDRSGPVHVRVGAASGDLFDVLGVRAALGRTFLLGEGTVPTPDDSALAALTVPVLLTDGFWAQRYGRSPDVVGTRLTLNGTTAEIVGVLPPNFTFSLPAELGVDTEADLWRPVPVPLTAFRRIDRLQDRDSDNTGAVVARTSAGTDQVAVRTRLAAVSSRLRAQHSPYADVQMRLAAEPLAAAAAADARPVLLVLVVATVLVLLVACLNVAGLLLARALEREQELIVQSALGAAPGRLVLSRLVESGVVAVAGGTAGLLAAAWLIPAFRQVAPDVLSPLVAAAGLHVPTAAFALGATVVAALLAGSVPAWYAVRLRPGPRLRARGLAHGTRARRPLVVAQIGIAFALLIAAGLLVQAVSRLRAVPPGFEAEGVLTFGIAFRGNDYPGPADRARLLARIHSDLAAQSGVRAVGAVAGMPLSGIRWTQPWGLDGEPPDTWGRRRAAIRPVTSDYFRALGTRLLAGRSFTVDEDLTEERRVAIVDERVARLVAPDGQALGRFITVPLDGDPVRVEIVGIVETVRQHGLRTTGPQGIYVPYRQEATRQVTVAVRTERARPEVLSARIRDAVRVLDPHLPVFDMKPLDAFVEGAIVRERFAFSLIAAFGTVGLTLALVGLYATVAHAVRQRRREFGIRRALGAPDAHITAIVVRDGLAVAAAGIAVGVFFALTAVASVRHLLFEVSPLDPLTWIGVAAVVGAATVAASWLPARTARRAEPMAVLRQD